MNREDPLWDATLAFLRRELPKPPATILEVGCGRGVVASELTRLGYTVTPIDPDQRAVASARRRGAPVVRADILSYDGGPFDACVCVYSLHHIHPLRAAVQRVRSLLKPGGRLLVNDYAWEEADEPTAAWLYDFLGAFVGAGIARARWGLPGTTQSPLEFWRNQHNGRSGERESPGRTMIQVVRSQFGSLRLERTPYLYSVVAGHIAGARRGAIARYLLGVEERQIREGSLRPLGLQMISRALSATRAVDGGTR